MSETHWKKLSNPNYLGSWDFTTGEKKTLTIKSITQEEVVDMEKVKNNPKAKKACIIAYFIEPVKPMILNKTNCKTITNLYKTPLIEQWQGKKIVIAIEKVKAFGQLEDALRIQNERVQNEIPKAPQPKIYTCGDCSKTVTDFGGYSAEQVAGANKKKYGTILCAECSKIRKEKEKESEVINEPVESIESNGSEPQ